MRTARRMEQLGLNLTSIPSEPLEETTEELDTCWFCGKRIAAKRLGNNHHLMPRRYFPNKENANRDGNVVRVHVVCHATWNSWHDKIELDAHRYRKYMIYMRWGKNVFKNPD